MSPTRKNEVSIIKFITPKIFRIACRKHKEPPLESGLSFDLCDVNVSADEVVYVANTLTNVLL